MNLFVKIIKINHFFLQIKMTNSSFLDGLQKKEAIDRVIEYLTINKNELSILYSQKKPCGRVF